MGIFDDGMEKKIEADENLENMRIERGEIKTEAVVPNGYQVILGTASTTKLKTKGVYVCTDSDFFPTKNDTIFPPLEIPLVELESARSIAQNLDSISDEKDDETIIVKKEVILDTLLIQVHELITILREYPTTPLSKITDNKEDTNSAFDYFLKVQKAFFEQKQATTEESIKNALTGLTTEVNQWKREKEDDKKSLKAVKNDPNSIEKGLARIDDLKTTKKEKEEAIKEIQNFRKEINQEINELNTLKNAMTPVFNNAERLVNDANTDISVTETALKNAKSKNMKKVFQDAQIAAINNLINEATKAHSVNDKSYVYREMKNLIKYFNSRINLLKERLKQVDELVKGSGLEGDLK